MLEPEYLIVGLLAIIAFLLLNQQSQPTLVVERPRRHSYSPFYHHARGLRRSHRFHGKRFRRH